MVSAQASAPATKVAVVDVPAVSDAYYKKTALEDDFEAMRAKFREQVDKEKKEIETLRRSMEEQFKPGTPDFEQRKEEGVLRETRLKLYMEREGGNLDGIVNASLRSIFEDIHKVVGKVAEEDGLDIVLAKDELPVEKPNSSDVLRQQIMLHKVMYFRPSLNITAKVIQRLNDEYVKNGGKAPAPKADGTAATPAPPAAGGAKKD